MLGLSRISAAAPYVPMIFWLFCDRCAVPFYTVTFRGACDACQDAAAVFWPGVIELPHEVSGA